MNEHVPGTVIAERLLARPEGATMDEIVGATGGPQYNLLRRLQARGWLIRKVKEGQTTRYFAEPPAAPAWEATMTSKGQVTIPKEVRERLRLRTGQKLRFTLEDGGHVVLTPTGNRLSDLFGVGKPPRSATLEEMDEAVRKRAVERYLRAVGRPKR